ncbi:hypothetical protein [Lignipirellula cremea]|uniref:hypothetical protein n=1 Tax=Lignipirellula cremea TaxID=2528010 RepID=UPI0011AA7DB7|nr:hypothetical protein [Lignipirellula cremea]
MRYDLWAGAETGCEHCRERPLAIAAPSFTQSPSTGLSAAAEQNALNFMASAERTFQNHELRVRRNQLRYAGRLIQDPIYHGELEALANRWEKFKDRVSFDLINGRLFSVPGAIDHLDDIAGTDLLLKNYLRDLCVFTTKWSLSGFVSWELPLPHRPLRGFSADVVAGLRGPFADVTHDPLNLAESTKSAKRARAVDGFEYEEVRPAGEIITKDETIFRLHFLECAGSQRVDRVQRGVMTRIQAAFATHFMLSDRSIKRLRSHYQS